MRYALATLLIANSAAVWAQNRPQMTFEGYIAGSAVLYVQGDRVDVQGRDTGSVDRPTYNFRTPLPPMDQRVSVDVRRGRGRVLVVEQPTPANEYTAVVRVDPPGNRHELYTIDFFWNAGGYRNERSRRDDRSSTRNRTNDYGGGSGEMTWSGEVDNEALIEVRGRRAFARTVRGREVFNEQSDFSGQIPRGAQVQLVDTQGRGRVELVEQPSQQNGNVAIVRILDPQSGAGRYSFRLAWNGGGGYSNNDPYYSPAPSSGGVLTPNGTHGSGSDPYGQAAPVTGYGSMMRWSGRVDGRVRVTVRGDRAWATRVSGGPVVGEQVSFGSPLPRRDVGDVELRKVQGRDDVEIVERPSARNGYSLVFEIDDNDGGADDYVIEVVWR